MRRYGSTNLQEAAIRYATETSLTSTFDVFLSHASEDRGVVLGVKAMMEGEGLSTYIDWLDDPQLDRSRVTRATAERLRLRMNRSRELVYVSSQTSSHSRWMPWELGYFDGHRPDHVSILPVIDLAEAPFRGIEFLSLYPIIERVEFQDLRTRFARERGDTYESLLARSRH
jgi:hypothetical protein